jgi:hypothetical protein
MLLACLQRFSQQVIRVKLMTPEHLLAGYISHAFKAYLSSFGLLQKEEKEAHQPEHQKVQSGVIDFSGKQLQVVGF